MSKLLVLLLIIFEWTVPLVIYAESVAFKLRIDLSCMFIDERVELPLCLCTLCQKDNSRAERFIFFITLGPKKGLTYCLLCTHFTYFNPNVPNIGKVNSLNLFSWFGRMA